MRIPDFLKRITIVGAIIVGSIYTSKAIDNYTSAPDNGRTYLFLSDRLEGFNFSDENKPRINLTIHKGEKFYVVFGAKEPDGIIRQEIFVNNRLFEEDKTPEGFKKIPIGLNASPRELEIPLSWYNQKINTLTYQITDSKGHFTSSKATITFQD